MKKNDEHTDDKKGFTEKQKQELKKYAVYGLLFVLFLGVIWLIFKPTESELAEENKGIGLNTEIPSPEGVELTQNKKNAYEQDYLKQKQKEKVKNLNNFALLAFGKDTINSDRKTNKDDPEERKVSLQLPESHKKTPLPAIQNSVDTYKKANEAVSGFYNSSNHESEEIKKLKDEIEKLKGEIQEHSQKQNTLDEHTQLMERSYQLAAKYFPQSTGKTVNQAETNTEPAGTNTVNNSHQKRKVVSVRKLSDHIVSALPQNMSDQEYIEAFSQERNSGFHTIGNNSSRSFNGNAIQVCIDRNQTISDGQSISLRLLVPIQVGDIIIPKNSLVAGKGSIQGERLLITVNSIEYDKMIFDVDLKAYDIDGQLGVFIPDMIEVNAAKEIAGNMGNNLGTSISLTQSAGQQIASDLGKSLIQGTSQYIQKKVRTIKINLKASYHLLLVAEKN